MKKEKLPCEFWVVVIASIIFIAIQAVRYLIQNY